jgi:glycosyltransferase involved in cell wall biosynthesis
LQIFWTAFLGAIALGWIVQFTRAVRGLAKLPRLARISPAETADCPRVSVVFAARDEAEKLPAALGSMLAMDYPDFEVIAVDDRSQDGTAQILDDAAQRNPRMKVVHVRELPAGWLGKPHALEKGSERATGEWLLFTDADVHFAPEVLRRAMAVARRDALDHLSLLAKIDLSGFWETVATLYFGVGFAFGVEPWRVPAPESRRYMGAGYFQLVRRSAYETIGTHRRLALEVVDDMKLGKLVKLGGFRSGVAVAESLVHLRWNRGLRELVHSVTKNFFAAGGFRVWVTLLMILATLLASVVPFLALAFAHGFALICAAVAAALAVIFLSGAARHAEISWLYGFTHPLGALLFCYMMLRSMVFTLWRGGIEWRGTFYPLEELRRGLV